MVRGIEIFRKYFREFTGSYVIIGGTACEQQFEEKGLVFRTTKDIDIVLVIEALDSPFVIQFWDFIKSGKYNKTQRDEKELKYYRFEDPANDDFPLLIELFSKKPDIIKEISGMRFTPIPVEDDLSSLSAILLDNIYYSFTKENMQVIDGLALASTEVLIALKANAFINMLNRKVAGNKIDSNKIKKHKNDVLRLAVTLNAESKINCPEKIQSDIATYINILRTEKPDVKNIMKEIGVPNIGLEDILILLSNTFLKTNDNLSI